jgi:NDP-sugar pyrophosphorylase family protein
MPVARGAVESNERVIDMRAIILAGGRGTRLDPLTRNDPKPLVPVFDRPLLFHQLDWLRDNGFTDIVVSVGYLGQRILDALNSPVPGLRLTVVREENPLGTAGAVALALDQVPSREPVLVIPGDALSNVDLESFFLAFSRQPEPMALLVHHVPDPRGFGVVWADDQGRVRQFVEKPATLQWGSLVNTGIYALRPDLLRWPTKRPLDFAYDVFPELVARRALVALRAEGYWSDLGTIGQYRQAHFDAMDGLIDLKALYRVPRRVKIAATARLIPPVWLGDHVVIDAEATVGPYAVIGSSSHLGPWVKVTQAIVGRGVVLGAETQLDGAVVADNVAAAGLCHIARDAVVGTGAQLYWGSVVQAGQRVAPDSRILGERRPAQGA